MADDGEVIFLDQELTGEAGETGDGRWTIRGVPPRIRAIVTRLAASQRLTVGEVLTEAVLAHVNPGSRSLAPLGGPMEVEPEAEPVLTGAPVEAVVMALRSLEARLARMEGGPPRAASTPPPPPQRPFGRQNFGRAAQA